MSNIEPGVLRFAIQSKTGEDFLILRPLPTEESFWGVLTPLQGTPWGDLIPVVSGLAMSHALHGYSLPFLQELGRPPSAQLRLIPEGSRTCAEINACVMADRAICCPCSKIPLCYVAPGKPDALSVFSAESVVVKAWAEGRYVIVVEGEEFRL